MGVCGGNAKLDVCNVCNGDGIREGDCDCRGKKMDCKDKCGGDKRNDICKVCDGPGVDEDVYCDCERHTLDCEGVCGGKKIWGVCGDCLLPEEHEHLIPGVEGTLIVERYPEGCCECDGSVVGCDGKCGSGLVDDACGVCNGLGIPPGFCDCDHNTLDCDYNCGGYDFIDVCGKCNGTGIQHGFCNC
jgi:hypothetical protein